MLNLELSPKQVPISALSVALDSLLAPMLVKSQKRILIVRGNGNSPASGL